jgi:phosphatidylinositol dimannoside acyltransferase
VKALLAYLGLRLGVGLVGLLPGGAARGLGTFAGRLWHRFDRRRRTMARSHMTRVLGDPSLADEAALAVMQSYGRYWAEALWARERRVAGLLGRTEVDGLQRILDARDRGKGMIFGLPHMGNWEAAAPVVGTEGVPVVAVAENLPNRRITSWFTTMRAKFGIEIVLATGGIEVMRKLEAALVANKAVALLADRDIRGRGVAVEFFGETTTLPAGPATLSIKTGAPLFPVATYFKDGGHRVVVRPAIPVPDVTPRSEQVRMMTQALATEMEKLILEAPEQWHLVVPNWPSDLAP